MKKSAGSILLCLVSVPDPLYYLYSCDTGQEGQTLTGEQLLFLTPRSTCFVPLCTNTCAHVHPSYLLQLEGFVATGFLSGGGRISYSEHARIKKDICMHTL